MLRRAGVQTLSPGRGPKRRPSQASGSGDGSLGDAMKSADYMISRLFDWGVRRVYGYPGDGINGLLGALDRASDKVDFIQVRHEELAAFMACAHFKFTGEVGVCMATSGPGAIHLLNGLYDAKMDHVPVVAIVGQAATAALGGDYQQEVDLISLFKDVAHEYVHMASSPVQIRHLVDRAFRSALATRGVSCIIVPKDVQEYEAVMEAPHKHNTIHSGKGYSHPIVVPVEEDLHRAAGILNEGKKVAILVGAGAKGAGNEVAQVADLLGAGVAKALLGKEVLPDTLPFVTGAIGLLGTKPSWDLMAQCDTLFMIGSSFPYSEFLPKEGQARGVQIDIDGRMLSVRYPMELNLIGDSRATLRALLPFLKRKPERAWREQIESGMRDWWKTLEGRAQEPARPINPQYVYWELSPRLPDGAILTADSGSSANWFARDLRIREGMMASLSGGLATMGPAVPYAIAAKFAHPDRPVIALAGDGAMQMNGLNGLITIAKYWRQWKSPKLLVLVLNNRDLNQVTWEQRVEAGDRKFPRSQQLPDFAFARYATALELRGIRVEQKEQVPGALDEALASDRPVVLEAMVDPEVPPLPPHITVEQAKHFVEAIARFDTETPHMVRQSWRDWFGGKRGPHP